MSLLIQIPILEEIYDLDSISLREITEQISSRFNELQSNKDSDALNWKKKAQKFLDLAVLELKEREVIENFGEYCSKQIQSEAFLKHSPYKTIEEVSKEGISQNYGEKPRNSAKNNKLNTNNNLNEISLPSISKQSINLPQKNKKQLDLFNFMKETLAATKIEENKFVIGKSAGGKYKYVPPKKKKKEKKLKRSKTEDYNKYTDNLRLQKEKKKTNGVILPKIGKSEEEIIKNEEFKTDKILMKKKGQIEKEEINIDKNENIVLKQEKLNIKNENQTFKGNIESNIIYDENLRKNEKELNNESISPEEENKNLKFNNEKNKNINSSLNINQKNYNTSNLLSNFEKNNDTNNFSNNNIEENVNTNILLNKFEKNNNLSNNIDKNLNLENLINSDKNLYPGQTSKNEQKSGKDFEILTLKEEKELKSVYEDIKTDSLSEKIDFQAKYKNFAEKTKIFNPVSLYNINESEDSAEESISEVLKQKPDFQPYNDNNNYNIEKNYISSENLETIQNPNNEQIPIKKQVTTHNFTIDQKENNSISNITATNLNDIDKLTIKNNNLEKRNEDNKKEKPEEKKFKKIDEKTKKDPIDTLKESKYSLQQTLAKYQKEKEAKIEKNEKIQKIPLKKPKPAPKAKLPQCKQIYELDDDKVVDYSSFFPSFNAIFSGYYNNLHSPQNFDYIETMKEIYSLFIQHVSKVDDVDKMLSKYKLSLAPMEFNPNELLLMNDPKSLSYYAYKTNIDVKNFLARQQIFEKKLKGELQDENIDNVLYYRVVKNREEVYDIVTKSFLRKLNWAELPHGINLKTSWNLLWTWSKPQIEFNKLVYFQKVNHYPMNKNMVRKDLLKKNIEKMQKLGSKTSSLFNFIPTTYVLPKEYCNFMDHFYHDMMLEGKQNIWIMKPIGKSRGRGISLINDISNVVYAEQVIVQKYLKNPLLLRGFKFDMRIYVLVTSIQPLEVFIYKEGFARLSTEPFTLESEDLNKLFIHLTNVAIQKNNVDFHKDCDTIFGGSKLSLKNLRTKLEERGYNFHKIWVQVCEIVVKTLLACQQEIPSNPNCFELFGYDIIIDDNMKCWLLEVNSSPSLSRETILDDIVKQQLIDDIMELVDPVLFDRKKLLDVLERRIKEEQGLKSTINTQNNSKQQMNRDLTYILNGKSIRKVGEMPSFLGNFERLAPSEFCDKIVKVIQQYKVNSGAKNYSSIE